MGHAIPSDLTAHSGAFDKSEQLDRRLPLIKFAGNGLADVVDFLRDVTGTNLFVNWRALEAASIEKDAPVNATLDRLKLFDALESTLAGVDDGKIELGYVIDDCGVIVISTRNDLDKTYGAAAVLPGKTPAARPDNSRPPTSNPQSSRIR
jgi:hypothetical protein